MESAYSSVVMDIIRPFSISFANLSFNCFRVSTSNYFTFSATAVAVVVSLNFFNFMLDLMKLLLAHLYDRILSYATTSAYSSSYVISGFTTNGKIFRRFTCEDPIYLSYPLRVLL